MPKVTIRPLNRTIEATEGATITEAAHAHGLYWPTTCNGEGICTSCACVIEQGAENLDPLGRSERKTLSAELGPAALRDGRLRLACQAQAARLRRRGDLQVARRRREEAVPPTEVGGLHHLEPRTLPTPPEAGRRHQPEADPTAAGAGVAKGLPPRVNGVLRGVYPYGRLPERGLDTSRSLS